MPIYTQHQIDEALDVIRHSAAADLRKVLVPPLPGYGTLLYRSKRDPAFGALFRAAIAGRPNPNIRSREDCMAALDVAEKAGVGSVAKLLDSRPDLPSLPTIRQRAKIDLTVQARLKSVMEGRYTSRGLRPRGKRFSDDAYLKGIEAMKSRAGAIGKRLRADHNLPTADAIRLRAQRDPALSDLLKRTLLRRRIGRGRKYESGLLQSQLRQMEVFRIANEIVPRKFDAFDRDEIVSEIIVQLLDGLLDESDLSRSGGRSKVIAKILRETGRLPMASLDEPAYDGDVRLTKRDMLTSNDWSMEAFA